MTAAALGLEVLVVEKAPLYGGTTAWSGGWLWIPRNPLARAAGIHEDEQAPRSYLRHELGEHHDEPRVEAFLRSGPRMVEFFQRHTALAFVDGNTIPDFHGASPGAVTGGRSLCAAPFDGRELGATIAQLRAPASFVHVAKRVGRHLFDLVRHGRGMQLVNGNALVARLAKSAFDRGVGLRLSSPVTRLFVDNGRVVGAVIGGAAGEQVIHACRGVVLACGGFPHDRARIAELFAHAPDGTAHHSAAPSGNTGDGLRLGEAVGAQVQTQLRAAGAWAPVSLVPRRDGSVGHFPHLIERAKPGLIAVTRAGIRFVNEADSYHDFMSALFAALSPGEPAQAWLVCDHRFIRRYGLGHAKPAPVPLGPSLRSGYLKRGRSLAELAQACGIDAAALQATVERYNEAARDGRDPAFGRGSTPYNRVQGEASQQPNPCAAPIEHGPFYAVRIVPARR